MWEQVGVTGTAVWGARGGTPLPRLCPCSGLDCGSTSAHRDPGMGSHPPHAASALPREVKDGRVGGGWQKFHPENTFSCFPKPRLSPAHGVGGQRPLHKQPHCWSWGCDPTAWALLCSLAWRATHGSHHCEPLITLVQGSPGPRILLEPRGHSRLPALSWPHGSWEPRQPRVARPGHRAHYAGPRGRRVPVAERGRAGATAPSGPSAGAAPLRVPLLAQNPAMKKT